MNQAAHPLFSQTYTPVNEGPNDWLQRYYGYYRRAIRDALSHSNRKPFQSGGLKGYDQLIAIEAHLRTRQQQLGTDPYLEQLHRRLKVALPAASKLAASVRQAHTCLSRLEHYLAHVTLPPLPNRSTQTQAQTLLPNLEFPVEGTAAPPTGQSEPTLTPQSDAPPLPPVVATQASDLEPQIQENTTLATQSDAALTAQSDAPHIPSNSQTVHLRLEQIVDQWRQSARLNSTLEKVCRKWDSMADKWLPAILHCYDIPGLPRNNLKLEARFGQLRSHQRRVSGRKETTPLRRLAPGQLLCQTLDDEELLSYLRSVPTDDYWRERRKQEALEESQRWLWRLHRHPLNALAQIDTQFSAFLRAKANQQKALDGDL